MRGHYSVDTDVLAIVPIVTRCRCRKCPGKGYQRPRTTHAGTAGGAAMTSGCEWHVRQWLRDARRRQKAMRGQVKR